MQARVTLAGKGCAPWYRKCDDGVCSGSATFMWASIIGGCCCCSGRRDSGGGGSATRGVEGEDEHDEVRTGAENALCGGEDFVNGGGGLCGAGGEGNMGKRGEGRRRCAAETAERGCV